MLPGVWDCSGLVSRYFGGTGVIGTTLCSSKHSAKMKDTEHLNVDVFEDLECVLKQNGAYEARMEKVCLYIIQEIIMNN